eukprot:TRINITY_DN2624_c0_g1_i4.p2 TRINITY_DN2624_c0_g1~~TRINITY_DN2624_c0_g1_i4.p2  ORF type:complete len:166 (-),score=56.84 TRINITY_DN2624_c0_g1_i4:52-549(-)
MTTYLVCHDGSAHSNATIDFIIKTAKEDSHIVFCGLYPAHTRQMDFVPFGDQQLVDDSSEQALREVARFKLAVQQRLLAAKKLLLANDNCEIAEPNITIRSVPVERDVSVGDAIIGCAEKDVDADIIVVGARGNNRKNNHMLGSTSAYVSAFASIPVVVCHEKKK